MAVLSEADDANFTGEQVDTFSSSCVWWCMSAALWQ